MKGKPFAHWVCSVLEQLPRLVGSPVRIDVRPSLTACRGVLLSNQLHRGHAVFAASFIRKRQIVLEEELLAQPSLLRSVLLHEFFHFVWVRAGNDARRNYADLLREELNGRARAEIGESAEISKARVLTAFNPSRWSHYVCESFCDTAAWYFLPRTGSVRLAERWRRRRAAWFRDWTSRQTAGLRL